MVSEKFSFENSKFYKDVWLIYVLATQQFRSFRWLIFPSIFISCKELKNAQIAQVNQLFQLLNLVRIQLFRESLSEKVHATIPKGIVGGFEFAVLQRNLKE